MTHVNANVVQTDFRFRENSGNEATPIWLAAINIDISIDVDTSFRYRVVVAETAGGTANNLDLVIFFSLNSGAFTAVGTTTACQFAAFNGASDGDATTQQLGSGSFVAGELDNDASVNAVSLISQETEMEYCLVLDSVQVANDDTIDLQAFDGTTALDSYTNTGRATAVEAVDFTADLTAASFGMSAQALTVDADFNVELTAASFGMSAQDVGVDTVVSIDLSAPEFGMAAQDVTFIAEFEGDLTAASFSMTAQDINKNAESESNLSAASFGMSAQDIDVAVVGGFELTAPEFGMTAQDISIPDEQIQELTAASFNMTGRTLFVEGGTVGRVQQGKRQLAFRILSGRFDGTYNEDVIFACLTDEPGIDAIEFNGILFEWLGLKGYSQVTLDGRMQAFADANLAFNWSSLGDFTV